MSDINFELDIVKSFKTVKKGDRVVVGYAMTSDLDSDLSIISREAMDAAQNDLLQYSTVLFNHNPDRPIGKVISTNVDDIGLLVKVVLSQDEEDIWNKVTEEIINKFSIKGRALDSEEVIGPNNQKVLLIKKLELYEISLVSVPANSEAKTIGWYVSKSLQEENIMAKKKKDEECNDVAPTKKESEEEIQKKGSEDKDVKKELKVTDIIDQLELIVAKDPESALTAIQELLNTLITEQTKQENIAKTKTTLIDRLKELSSKLSGDDKILVDEAIDALKNESYGNGENYVEHLPNSEKSFDFTDVSSTRPIYQLNAGGVLELVEGTGKFRKQILKLGKWYHWNAEEGILNVTKEILEKIVKNFKDKVLDHVTVPLTHSSNPALNTGEVTDLIQTKEGLDAICEIKDLSVVEKIKNGLIKSISASLDPNYLNKETGSFMGPVVLHAALVQEPYIKGMGDFIQLSEEFEGRPVLQFEDTKLTVSENLQILKNVLSSLEKQVADAEIVDMTDIERSVYTDCMSREMKSGKDMADAAKICKVEVKKQFSDVILEKVTPEEEVAYAKCLAEETERGTTKSEAIKICKERIMKKIEEVKEQSPKENSEEIETKSKKEEVSEKSEKVGETGSTGKVELVDSEGVYEKYLRAGKVVPAQKEALLTILNSKGTIELGDTKVDIKKALIALLESQPRVVDFSEEGTSTTKETPKPPVIDEKKEIPTEVKEFYMDKMELSEEEATKAWQDAKAVHDAEKNVSTVF